MVPYKITEITWLWLKCQFRVILLTNHAWKSMGVFPYYFLIFRIISFFLGFISSLHPVFSLIWQIPPSVIIFLIESKESQTIQKRKIMTARQVVRAACTIRKSTTQLLTHTIKRNMTGNNIFSTLIYNLTINIARLTAWLNFRWVKLYLQISRGSRTRSRISSSTQVVRSSRSLHLGVIHTGENVC